eukprot:IDg17590t1
MNSAHFGHNPLAFTSASRGTQQKLQMGSQCRYFALIVFVFSSTPTAYDNGTNAHLNLQLGIVLRGVAPHPCSHY